MSCCDTKHPTTTQGLGACAPGAFPGGLRRTRFFDGMVLTQADLENEQRFWRIKRRLTNRALGEGVVWGLRLRWDARRRVFTLGPGYALDCCGNDLVVECPVEISESDLIARADPLLRPRDPATFQRASTINQLQQACLVLQYVECPEDARPVQVDACSPPGNRCESSRIRETTRLLLVPPPMPDPPTCLDDVFTKLDELKQSIQDAQLRDALFPPPQSVSPQPLPQNATLPVTLRVATPGTGSPNETTVTPPANGTATAPAISGTRVPGGLRAGVVQFELRPIDGWGFYQGQVTEGGTVVDMVAPPLDLQQFWALEIALPDNVPTATQSFRYVVDQLGLEQMFGARAKGLATLTISGTVTATVASATAASSVTTRVEGLTVEVTSSVGEAAGAESCFDVLRWAFMADPDHAADDAKLLLLAALYAYFADVTSRSGGTWTHQRVIASALYTLAWRLLGVNVSAGSDDQKQELGRILAELFECWCDAMLYPGPRCASEHHGVYLGCATVARTGQIVAFDMWEHRREVITGPLVNHWLGVFGFAPVDVVAGRIAQAICCIAGLPVPSANAVGVAGANQGNRIPIGRGSMTVGSTVTGQQAQDVGTPELVARIVSAFVSDGAAPLATFRTRLANGTVVELVAPQVGAAGTETSLTGAIDPLVRDATPRLAPIAGSVVRRAAAELAREVPATAIPDLSPAAGELAKQLGGMTLAALVEAGPDGVIAAAPSADAAAVDDLLAKADTALGQIVDSSAAAARKAKPARPSVALRDTALRKAIAGDVTKRFDGVTKAAVEGALERAASQGS